mmetsp:Transcript_16562/g.32682  ORF Transcript_16562/g.32682 Transcript_16562/m.32682 type:complete len:347 (-) Transcript_16562:32-1072(-)
MGVCARQRTNTRGGFSRSRGSPTSSSARRTRSGSSARSPSSAASTIATSSPSLTCRKSPPPPPPPYTPEVGGDMHPLAGSTNLPVKVVNSMNDDMSPAAIELSVQPEDGGDATRVNASAPPAAEKRKVKEEENTEKGKKKEDDKKSPAAPPRPGNWISAEDLQGCWGCICLPAFAALERKRAEGPDVIVHEGCCFPCLSCYSEAWERSGVTNTFKKRGADDVLHYTSPGGLLCFGPGCTVRLARCNTLPPYQHPAPKIPANEIEGCWGCATSRCTFCALERRFAEGDDTLIHRGVCFPCCLPFREPWDREGQSNVFIKRGKPDRLQYHAPGGLIIGKEYCTCRLCK